MKNRLPAHRPPAKEPKPPKGRYARVFLSSEFLAWCQRNTVRPAEIAACLLHTDALKNPGTQCLTIVSSRPDADERIFDKPKGGA